MVDEPKQDAKEPSLADNPDIAASIQEVEVWISGYITVLNESFLAYCEKNHPPLEPHHVLAVPALEIFKQTLVLNGMAQGRAIAQMVGKAQLAQERPTVPHSTAPRPEVM